MRIEALFSSGLSSPAFLVECRNDGPTAYSNEWPDTPNHVRVDSQPVEPLLSGVVGGIVGPINTGESWRAIIELRQALTEGSPTKAAPPFGANVHSVRPIELREGHHTIAIRCGDRWSEDYAFTIDKAPTTPHGISPSVP